MYTYRDWPPSYWSRVNISWYRTSRQKWLRKSVWRLQHLHDQCGQWQQWHGVHQHAQHVGLSTPARCVVFVLLTDTSHPHWLKSSLSLSLSSTCHPCVVGLDSLRRLLLLPPALPRFLLSFLSMYSDDLDSVTNNLRDSAKGSNDGYDAAFPLTGYEPNDTELNDTELNDTVPASSLTSRIPSSTIYSVIGPGHGWRDTRQATRWSTPRIRRLPPSGRCMCQSVVNVCHGRSNGETCGKEWHRSVLF